MEQKQHSFAPVVTVLGHVDHGKTSLLDAIRKTSIAAREHGGITQKIGTSSISIEHEGKSSKMTFIDTPGHAAFSKMRSQGANAADIGLLIVAANDGVMPQTKESIALLKEAEIPYIVVLTKSDLPTKNVDRVKQQLSGEGVLMEGLGGDTPVIEVASTTGHNIKELLDLILLVWEFQSPKDISLTAPVKAVVIESKRDPKSGPKATIIVKNGKLTVRDVLYADQHEFKVRSLMDETGKQLQEAIIGDGVEILGMSEVLEVGSVIQATKDELVPVIEENPTMYQANADNTGLFIILIADTKGSLEAIMASLPKEIKVVSAKTGEVSEADILMAKSVGGFVVSFNVRIRPEVVKLASTEKVLAKNYTIIYEMIDELSDALEGKQLAGMEEIYGVSQVQAKFPFEKSFAFGIRVMEGRVAQRDKIRVMRGEEIVGETHISSLRVGKDQVTKVEEKKEAGILLSTPLDIQPGDVILSHS